MCQFIFHKPVLPALLSQINILIIPNLKAVGCDGLEADSVTTCRWLPLTMQRKLVEGLKTLKIFCVKTKREPDF